MPYGWIDGELRDESRRREAVLVLRGTGLNFWQFLPLLRSFRLSELLQFKAIYTVSGSSLLLWLYSVMEPARLALTAAAEYDRAMRAGLNRRGWLSRTASLLTGSYLYRAEDFLQVFESAHLPRSMAADARRSSVGKLAHRGPRRVSQTAPGSRAGIPSRVGRRRSNLPCGDLDQNAPASVCFRTRYHGMIIGDFDFAGASVRRGFYDYLHRAHPRAPVYHINMFRNGERATNGSCVWATTASRASGRSWTLRLSISVCRILAMSCGDSDTSIAAALTAEYLPESPQSAGRSEWRRIWDPPQTRRSRARAPGWPSPAGRWRRPYCRSRVPPARG